MLVLPAFAQSHIPVYSTLPAYHAAADVPAFEIVHRRRIKQAGHHSALRNCASLLPWPMDTLDKTTWRNIWTGSIRTVRFGHLDVPYDRWHWNLFENETLIGMGLGIWWQERYIIDNWVRVDHLPADVQVAWFNYQLACLHTLIDRHKECIESWKTSTLSTAASNIAWLKRDIQSTHNRIAAVEAARLQFAQAHGLILDLAALNAGRIGQLVLF